MKTLSCGEGYTGEKCNDCDEENGWIKFDGKCIFMFDRNLA